MSSGVATGSARVVTRLGHLMGPLKFAVAPGASTEIAQMVTRVTKRIMDRLLCTGYMLSALGFGGLCVFEDGFGGSCDGCDVSFIC